MGAVMSPNNGLQCGEIYLPSGWARDIAIEFGAAGEIAAVRPAAPEDPFPKAAGPVLPGLPNLHSHAFQRALAGLTERAGPAGDDFWSWRQAVYRFVPKLAPEDVEAIASGNSITCTTTPKGRPTTTRRRWRTGSRPRRSARGSV